MQKLLISLAILASFLTAGCAGVERLPFVHRVDVQQGNVVEQADLNRLEPGMDKRQVQLILGSPMIADTFHPERWDYIYWMDPGRGERESYRVTLLFENDRLSEITGDKRPDPDAADAEPRQSATVTVPPQQRKPRGLLSRLWQWITFSKGDELPR